MFLLLWKLGLKKIIENFRTEINDIIRKKKQLQEWVELKLDECQAMLDSYVD